MHLNFVALPHLHGNVFQVITTQVDNPLPREIGNDEIWAPAPTLLC